MAELSSPRTFALEFIRLGRQMCERYSMDFDDLIQAILRELEDEECARIDKKREETEARYNAIHK